MKKSIPNLLKLVISVAVCLSAGFIGSIFTTPSIPGWYASLAKPSFNPPSWIFGPVWTILFILMGVSFYIVWKSEARNVVKRKAKRIAYSVFCLQFVLNILWSFLFFYMQCPLCAFVEIILLWFVIMATIIIFWKVSKSAAYLLIPYICWVSFATLLNFMIMILN